jgi:hypothetical protein
MPPGFPALQRGRIDAQLFGHFPLRQTEHPARGCKTLKNRLSTASALFALLSRSALFYEDGDSRQSGNRIEPCDMKCRIHRKAMRPLRRSNIAPLHK